MHVSTYLLAIACVATRKQDRIGQTCVSPPTVGLCNTVYRGGETKLFVMAVAVAQVSQRSHHGTWISAGRAGR